VTPEIDRKFAELKQTYGASAVERVEAMLYASPKSRDPLQHDARFVMPGLSTTPWLDTDDYEVLTPLVSRLEQEHKQIKAEVNALIKNGSAHIGNYQHYLGTQRDWDALYLYKGGQSNDALTELLPTSWDIFQNELSTWHCPLLEVHYSILKPGAVIKPHCDLWNFTINLHLAVDIPTECSITVANDERHWEEGKCLLFDYSYEHEASNRHPNQHRICLLMDIWHPNLTAAEKLALVTVITEVRALMGE